MYRKLGHHRFREAAVSKENRPNFREIRHL
jgi:hypothetical protein